MGRRLAAWVLLGGLLAAAFLPAPAGACGLWVWPVPPDSPISQGFLPPEHYGVDFAVAEGTPVYAVAPGRVVFGGEAEDYGLLVIVQAGEELWLFGHLSAVLVRPGQGVLPGEVLGLSGNTGRSTGAHLHFELRRRGVRADPAAGCHPGPPPVPPPTGAVGLAWP